MTDTKQFVHRLITFFLDLICFFVVVVISLSMTTNASLAQLLDVYKLMIILYITILGLVLLLSKCYMEPIRDYTLVSALRIVGSLIIGHIIFILIMLITGQPVRFYTLLNLIIYSIAFCGAYRLLIVSVFMLKRNMLRTSQTKDMKRVIIFGAGDAGKYLANQLNQDRSKMLVPVAFIDDDPALERKKIKGLLVVGPRVLIPYAAKKFNADTIIIAIPFVNNSTIREIFNLCCEANCTVKRFGNMSNLAFEGLSKSTITEVRVEDLLQREVVRLDLENIYGLIKDKVVLVTGGAGSIGSELCRQIIHYGAKLLVIFDMNENALFEITMEFKQKYNETLFAAHIGSTRDKDMLRSIFQKYKPEIVFHAAAYKHVPVMEKNFHEAVFNNIVGTQNAVDVSLETGVERFILVSTDKAVNPTNIMGATKRVAEMLIQDKNRLGKTLFAAVRFGNVLGSNGSVIPIFQKQLRAGGPLTVTHKDIQRYFMTIPEAVQLVLEAASITQGGEIFVLDMGEPVRIYDLATTMIKLSGLEPDKDIKIEITGLRPGEKLFEELNLTEETVNKTSNNKIFVLKSGGELTPEETQTAIEKLSQFTNAYEYIKAYEQMKILVPTFKNDLVS